MKERAIGELECAGAAAAYASMLSDLGKHPETGGLVAFASLAGGAAMESAQAMREFIEGFAE